MGTDERDGQMQVCVLGDIAVDATGARPISGPTQRRSLAYLVAHRDRVATVDQLVDVCWPDGDAPDRADHNVRTYVHRLRSALGDESERIATVPGGYRLRLEPGEVDVDRFMQLADEADRLIATGDLAAGIDRIREAERLWRGRPYAEFADEPWAMPETVRITEQRVSLVERHAEALLEAGRAGDAVVALDQLVTDEPLRERPRALLMRALYESGRQAEALRAFQDFRRVMIDEIGVEPSNELVALDRSIAIGELAPSPATARSVGGYELHERIGEGAFAVVHRATQASLGREVAVKIVRAELANQPEFIRRFGAEAQMVARIEHPNVVPLYDYWREPDRAYLVMRWMTGGSLEQRLDDGPLSTAATLELVAQIAGALDAAHGHGVVHRDVKPENILFDDDGRAYLGDFGIALDAEERARPEAALSEGSPVYAAPEQLRRESVGPEADVHALGMVTYTMLVGRPPFADTPDEPTLVQRRLHDVIPSVRESRPDLPAAVDQVLATATATDPVARYPSASAFATALRAALADEDVHAAGPAVRPRVNPYKGLRAFDETDANDFHGRDRLVDELVGHLDRPGTRLLAVVGPSGSGKSSVVRAGLIPALRRDRISGSGRWFTTTMVPGAHPFEALETALLRVAVNPPAALLDQLRDGDRGILRSVRRIVPADDAVVTIVIDQFEELFTGAVADSEREGFLRALSVAITDSMSPVRVVLTLRADFYDRPLRHPDFAPLLKQHTVVVTPLAPDELEHAIVTPAAAVGVGFEPGLVAEIIADVNHEPGALPLLQYALTQAFDATDDDTIMIEGYRSIGGLTGALGRRAEELYEQSNGEEQGAARRLFGRLVALGEGTEDTRRRVHLTELRGDAATASVLDRFGRARLLTFDRDPASREPTVEIAHEALLREWPRLRSWLDDDRDSLRAHRHLTAAAAGWLDRRFDPNELYRGGRLEAAETLTTHTSIALNDNEQAFLRASVQRREEEAGAERRRVRRLHRLVTATTMVAVVALVAGVIALGQWSRADREAARAETNEQEALTNAEAATANEQEAITNAERAATNEARAEDAAGEARASAALAEQRAEEAENARAQADLERLRSVAVATAAEQPALAALLAVEAQRIDPSVAGLDALHRVLTTVPGLQRTISGRVYWRTELLGDDMMVALADSRVRRSGEPTAPTIEVWNLADRRLVTAIEVPSTPGAPASPPAFDVSADGSTAVASVGTEAIVVDLVAAQPGRTIEAAGPVSDVSLDPAGDTVAVALSDGNVELWPVDGAEPSTTLTTGEPLAFARWNPTGDGLATVTPTSKVQYWDVDSGDLRWTAAPDGLNTLTARPTGILFSTNGELVVVDSGSLSPVLRTYRTVDGSQPFLPVGRSDGALGQDALFWWDADRLQIGVPSATQITVYDLTTGAPVGAPIGQLVANDVVYSSSLREVVLASAGGLEFRSTIGAGPLERVVLLTDEQRRAIESDGGTVHPVISADGRRLIVSALANPDIAPTTSYDLTNDPVTPGDFPYDDRIAFGNGDLTMTFGLDPFQFQLLDADDQPIGSVPLTFDTTDQDASENGRWIATAHVGGVVRLYTGAGELVETFDMELEDDPGVIVMPSFSSDGDHLMATTGAGSNAVWSTESMERIDDGTLVGQSRIVGDLLANRSAGVVRLYDLPSFEQAGPAMVDKPGGMFYPALDAANGRIAVTSQGNVTVYDLATGEQLGRELPYRPIRIEYTADGRQLAVGSDDRVTVWNYDTDTWPDIACQVAGRNLTRDEWAAVGPRTIEYRATCEQYPIEE